MKPNILCDWGYVFDYLSILELKYNKDDSELNRINYRECWHNTRKQTGNDLFAEITKSKEYNDLYSANLKTFDLVALAKNNLCHASEVDAANYNRFLCKKALQEKFFTEVLSEVKIGY